MPIRSMAWLLGLAALLFAGPSAGAQNPKPKAVLKVDKGLIADLAFSPDGKTLAAAFGGPGIPPGIHLWDVETGKLTSSLSKTGNIKSLCYSPDGKTLAITPGTGAIFLLDPATGEKQFLGKGNTEHVAFSPDGKTLASADHAARPKSTTGQYSPHSITIWDAKTRKERTHIPLGLTRSRFLAFSPDSKTLASVRDGGIDLIATGSAKTTKRLTGGATCVAFSPDGKTLASGSGSAVKMWDVANGKELATLKRGAYQLAFSPDGKSLAAASGSFSLWNVEAGKETFNILVRDAHKDVPNDAMVRSLAFSPDGRTIATACNGEGSQKTVVALWEVPPAK